MMLRDEFALSVHWSSVQMDIIFYVVFASAKVCVAGLVKCSNLVKSRLFATALDRLESCYTAVL